MRFVQAFLVLGLLILGGSATAEARPSSYNCEIRGEMSGIRLGFIFGGQLIGGQGILSCKEHSSREDATVVNTPVRLTIVGGGVGFDFTIVRRVTIVSAGIGGVRRPSDLTGQFAVKVSAGLTVIDRGYNVESAISVKNRANGLGFELGFLGEDAIGLGARLHGLILVVEPIR